MSSSFLSSFSSLHKKNEIAILIITIIPSSIKFSILGLVIVSSTSAATKNSNPRSR